jgi:hypothetical protein
LGTLPGLFFLAVDETSSMAPIMASNHTFHHHNSNL